jgi:hypothetical protein
MGTSGSTAARRRAQSQARVTDTRDMPSHVASSPASAQARALLGDVAPTSSLEHTAGSLFLSIALAAFGVDGGTDAALSRDLDQRLHWSAGKADPTPALRTLLEPATAPATTAAICAVYRFVSHREFWSPSEAADIVPAMRTAAVALTSDATADEAGNSLSTVLRLRYNAGEVADDPAMARACIEEFLPVQSGLRLDPSLVNDVVSWLLQWMDPAAVEAHLDSLQRDVVGFRLDRATLYRLRTNMEDVRHPERECPRILATMGAEVPVVLDAATTERLVVEFANAVKRGTAPKPMPRGPEDPPEDESAPARVLRFILDKYGASEALAPAARAIHTRLVFTGFAWPPTPVVPRALLSTSPATDEHLRDLLTTYQFVASWWPHSEAEIRAAAPALRTAVLLMGTEPLLRRYRGRDKWRGEFASEAFGVQRAVRGALQGQGRPPHARTAASRLKPAFGGASSGVGVGVGVAVGAAGGSVASHIAGAAKETSPSTSTE